MKSKHGKRNIVPTPFIFIESASIGNWGHKTNTYDVKKIIFRIWSRIVAVFLLL